MTCVVATGAVENYAGELLLAGGAGRARFGVIDHDAGAGAEAIRDFLLGEEQVTQDVGAQLIALEVQGVIVDAVPVQGGEVAFDEGGAELAGGYHGGRVLGVAQIVLEVFQDGGLVFLSDVGIHRFCLLHFKSRPPTMRK